ncbi:MAG: MFS transporter [Elusimicrobiota bacterium]|jgi:MFS family permease
MKGIGRNVWVLGIVSGLTDISSEMLYPIVPLFLTAQLGAPMAAVGLIEGTAEATASLLKAVGGRLSDRLGRRKPFVLAGYGLSALSKPLMALATGWTCVLFTRFIDRTGKGLRTAPRDALIAAACDKEHRGLAYGFHRAMDTAGAALGPLTALGLMHFWGLGYRQVFLAAFVPGLLGVLALAAFAKETRPAEEEAPAALPPAAPVPAVAASPLSSEFKRFLWIYGLFAICNSSDVFLLLRMKAEGFGTEEVLLAYVAYNVVYAALAMPAGRLSDSLGRPKTLALGLGIFACVYLGFAFLHSRAALWALWMSYGLYGALTEGVAKAYVADLSTPASRASLMGYFQGMSGGLAFAASAAAGLLWTHVGAPAPFLMGALGAAAAASFFLLRAPSKARY